MILKLGMKHQVEELYKVYINHDPGMTLTYFMSRSMYVAHAFEWGKLAKCHLKGKTYRKWANGLKIYDSDPKGSSAPSPGRYTCIVIIHVFKYHLL